MGSQEAGTGPPRPAEEVQSCPWSAPIWKESSHPGPGALFSPVMPTQDVLRAPARPRVPMTQGQEPRDARQPILRGHSSPVEEQQPGTHDKDGHTHSPVVRTQGPGIQGASCTPVWQPPEPMLTQALQRRQTQAHFRHRATGCLLPVHHEQRLRRGIKGL